MFTGLSLHLMNKVIDLEGQYHRGLPGARAGAEPHSQLIAQPPAKIQAKPRGAMTDPAVAPGEAFLEDPGKILRGNPHTVIRHGQQHLLQRDSMEIAGWDFHSGI